VARLDSKVALVTGAGRGLGAETARAMAAEGAAVAVSDVDAASAKALADELVARGSKAIGLAHDVSSEASWSEVLAAAARDLGPLDILVNNAGVLLVKSIAETTLDDFHRLSAVNVDGVFLGIKNAFAAMGERGGAIINLSSVAGLMGAANQLAYHASKGSVRLMTKCAAMEAATLGWPIRCNSIHPGVMDTPMTQIHYGLGADNENTAGLLSMVPSGRFGTPADIAWAAVYLASDEASYVNGAELVVDGGFTAGRAIRPDAMAG
jgi:NAD(P)-dependent dehydrogenase (short-subunit alcohol dehydrogenase family)